MNNYLKARNVTPSFLEELQDMINIDSLIEKFFQISSVTQFSQFSNVASAAQKQTLFYKERIANLEKKVRDLKS